MQEPGFPTGSSLSPSAPRKRTRRRRTVFSTQQLRVLEEFFERKRYGTYEERETLATRLNLQENRVQVWLKNRRAKDCRLQRLRGHPGERAHAGPQKLGVWAPQAAPEPAGPVYQEDPVLPASSVLPASPVLPATAARMQEPGFPTGSSLSPSAPRKRTRRRRTVFSTQQLRVLEEFFERKRYGTYEERETLATRLKLQECQVQAWLQNRRDRDHRLQRLREHPGERAHAALQEQGVCAPQAAPAVPASQEDPVLPAGPVFPAGRVLLLLDGPVLPAATLHHGGPGFCRLPQHRPLQVFPAADPSAFRCLLLICLFLLSMANGCCQT
ncbi:PREDICTED: homeobox protein MSX-2-like [Myotis brandtii]|uniref:homeobox protein MSX-2-like n=1 Tax=Myotis brandtii TaxID=109478 RepID=UPI0003BBE02C|nr:PREDICTED: homeobox protein MSX-2-like [Myotis brandtii]